MATITSIPIVKAALVELFQQRDDLADVQVAYSHPGSKLRARALYLGDATVTWDTPVMHGDTLRLAEDYTLEVYCNAAAPGPDSSQAETLCFDLVTAVIATCAGNPRLNVPSSAGVNVLWCKPAAGQLRIASDEQTRGWAAVMKMEVAVAARLAAVS